MKLKLMNNVTIEFNKKCKKVDFEKTTAIFKDYDKKEEFQVDADVIFGTDGAGSALAKKLLFRKEIPI